LGSARLGSLGSLNSAHAAHSARTGSGFWVGSAWNRVGFLQRESGNHERWLSGVRR
uniref:Uncharacterized protein n=1 Tax=Cucumis melo TaxID=3656 RepID=A0A9I9E401_CUCME